MVVKRSRNQQDGPIAWSDFKKTTFIRNYTAAMSCTGKVLQVCFYKNGPNPASFCLFRSCRLQRVLNTNYQSWRRARCPLDHRHGPSVASLSRHKLSQEVNSNLPLIASYNTFYPFQNKHQIHRHLQNVKMLLCAFKKSKFSVSWNWLGLLKTIYFCKQCELYIFHLSV